MRFSTLALATALCDLSIAGYVLKDDYMTDFYGNFDFFTGPDPTNGFVKYVDEITARQSNLISSNSTSVAHFGVDTRNKTPNGRPSIRLESKRSYNKGLVVLDVEHMPFGCGTWPAFWMLGPNWPTGGEIDIIEGVNDETNNAMTLHTGPGCAIGSDLTQFSGSVTTPNCDVAAVDQSKNAGCSIKSPSKQTYGAGLNQNKGGVYATQWDAKAISVYFFPRGSIPADVLGDSPDPSGWGKPAAKFTGACDIEKMFSAQKIVIDTTFCGDWAGAENVWNSGSCGKKAATCKDYVRDNPQAFTEAYWKINALKVYQNNGASYPVPSAPSGPSKSTALSVPAPISTVNSVYPPIAPLPSSKVASSALVPGIPPKPTGTPVIPIPSVGVPVPSVGVPIPSVGVPVPSVGVPIPSVGVPVPSIGVPVPGVPSLSPQSSLVMRPSRTINSQIAAPTNKYGMKGWQWPAGGSGQPDNDTLPSATPGLNTSTTQPSPAPVASQAAPLNPNVEGVVQTVYHTVYVTVSADPAATPTPGVKAHMARHARNHRRRWTQHNARS